MPSLPETSAEDFINGSAREQFEAFLGADVARWATVIRDAHVVAE